MAQTKVVGVPYLGTNVPTEVKNGAVFRCGNEGTRNQQKLNNPNHFKIIIFTSLSDS